MLRGIRGAISVDQNTKEDILDRTEVLLREIHRRNDLDLTRIASIFFTMTPDLNADFPAVAARLMGWTGIPLMCAVEVDVPEALPRCIRVLIHYNAENDETFSPVYMGEAVQLRKDLIQDAGSKS
jgi:chorismate mutase